MLNQYFDDPKMIEIGVDEVGRGPMLGRVYSAAVVLPRENFKFEEMKDSKKFHSESKIRIASEYIKKNAIAWSVGHVSEGEVDEINIRNATHRAMHKAIRGTIGQLECYDEIRLVVDGNDFKPYMVYQDNMLSVIPSVCVEGGDNKYAHIAAASILAKVARDDYIRELCSKNPLLDEKYGIMKNKGYGTKQHMDGIKEHGITEFHRKTFGICRTKVE